MPDPNERDAKLVQYLSEAYGKEKELETSLQAHITMTTRAPYKKRLQEHLRETKRHAQQVERRIKKLGGGGVSTQTLVGKTLAAAKGPMHMIRGTGEQEKMLKNAKTEYFSEHEEIATYRAIEAFADKVGDRETAKLAREIRREEERMAKFLERQIDSLAGAVVQEEVPSDQRAKRRKSSSRSRSSAAKKSSSTTKRGSSAKRSSTAKRSTSTAKRGSSTAKKSSSAKSSPSRSRPSATRKSSGSRKRS